LLRQRQNMKGNDSTDQGKTKHTKNRDKSCNLKNTKQQTQGPKQKNEDFANPTTYM